MFWFYLFYVAASELLVLTSALAGVVAYALMLIALTIHAALAHNTNRRLLARGLLFIPLARILSLSMPFGMVPLPVWSAGVASPLLISMYILARQARFNWNRVGIHIDGLWLQLGVASGGLAIGVAEYKMFTPTTLFLPSSIAGVVMLYCLLMFIGITEEFLFRGLFQHLSIQVLGRFALIYMSLLSAALFIGYRSLGWVVFAFCLALCFASVARWSKSIVGVALAHGISNVTFYLLMPLSASNPKSIVAMLLIWASGAGACLAIGAFMLLMVQRVRNGISNSHDHSIDEALAGSAGDDITLEMGSAVGAHNHRKSAGRKARSKRRLRPLKKLNGVCHIRQNSRSS